MKRIYPKRKELVYIFSLLTLSIFLSTKGNAQIIDESFEEAEWTTGMANTTSGAVTITSTSQSSTITYYTGAASSNTLMSTNTTPNKGVWWYSVACTNSDDRLRRVRSKSKGVRSNGRGYLITPVTKGAIVSVTFWASLGSSSSSNQVVVGINTNTNAVQPTNSVNQTNSTHSNYPFHWGHNSSEYSHQQQSFSAPNSNMQQFTYTGTFSGPARIGFFNQEAGTVYIDDIVVMGPTGADPTVATTGVVPGKNVANISGSAFAGTPVPSMPLAYSGVIWSTSNTGMDTSLATKTRNFPPNINTYPGAFTNTATGLVPGGTQYYGRAYAVTLDGEPHYGAILPFNTLNATAPTLSTVPAYNILSNKATSGGNNIDSGGTNIIQKGICWSKTANPTTALTTKTQQGAWATDFTSLMTNLEPSTTYHVRAYAENSIGTGYGPDITFTTSAAVPVLTAVPQNLNFGNIAFGSSTAIMSYVLSGNYLTANGTVTATAPAGYQVSLNSSNNFGNSVSITYANTTLPNKTIYVKAITNTYGTFNGYVLHTGGGTIPTNADTVFINGSVVQDPDITTNSGTDFWLGFGYQSNMDTKATEEDVAQLSIYVAATEQSATVVVDMPNLPGVSVAPWNFPRTITVPANTVVEVKNFPIGDSTAATNPGNRPDSRLYFTGVTNRGIHVYSANGAPIAVWMYTYTKNNSAAGAMIFPSNTWNSSYTVQSYGGTSNSGEPTSFFYAIANEDNTVISFTPTQPIVTATSIFNSNQTTPATTAYAAGGTYQVTLNKGQVFNAMGGFGSNNNGLDLSGTTIKALDCKKKIAVFGGNGRVLVNTASSNVGSGSDNLVQQMFPKVAWGTRYLTVPTKSMEFNTYRIYVQDAATVVKLNGNVLPKTPAGATIPYATPSWDATGLYYSIQTSQPSLIEADKPVTVAQFIISGGATNSSNGNNGTGDPEMIILSPVQQSIGKATVYSSNFKNGASGGHYINVVIKNEGVPTFKLDPITNPTNVADTGSSSYTGTVYGSSGTVTMTNAFRVHPQDPAYSYAKFKVSGGATHNISSDYPFNAIAYGMVQGESYGYNAGTAIKNLSAINIADNPHGSDTSTTSVRTGRNNPMRLKIALPYDPLLVDSIRWDAGTNTSITPNGISWGPLDPTPTNNLDSFARYIGTKVIDGRTFYVYESPMIYSFAQDGTFDITVRPYGTFGNECGGFTDHIIKVVVMHDDMVFAGTIGACGSTTVTFNNTSTAAAGTSVKQWSWDFGDGTTYTSSAATPNPPAPHAYPPLSSGVSTYWVKLTSINSVGYQTVDSILVDLSFDLKAKFVASADTICAGSSVTFTDQSTSNAIEWTWQWGDATANTVVTGTSPTAPVQHTFTNAGTYNVKLSVKNAAGCTSAIVDTNIVVIAKPVVDFQTPPGICLGGSMQFTNLTTPTTGVTYAWDFNDPNATGANPNTSNAQNPTHIYTSTGPFNVSLTVTDTHYGCSASKTKALASTIYALPTAAIAAPASACLKDTVQFTDASTPGTGNTLTEWNWAFGDGGTASVQNPKHPYYVMGNQTVTLTVKNDKGCVSPPVTHTINIKPIPNVVFAVIPNICANAAAFSITQASETTGMAGASPSWTYAGTGVSGTSFTPATAGVGTFPIIATYNAANGCKHADTTDVTVMPLPTVAFTVGTITCEKASISFTDNSTPNSSSIQSWGWNFGDASATVNAQNTSHTYAAAGSYVATLTVTNSNNCTASLPKTVVVHNRPFAEFSMPASVCLPDGGASFTNLSTVADDANPSYAWNFGDPNNASGSTIKDPTHHYSSVGPFTVQLTVTSQFGCVKDTTHILSTVHPEPVADFTALPFEVCLGDTIKFSGSSANNTVTWSWTLDDGSSSTIKNPVHEYGKAGTFNVTYYYTDAFGCKSNTVTKPVKVNPYPVMDAGPTVYVLQGYGAELKATAQGNDLKFLWTPNTFLNYDTLLNPKCFPTADQFYTLRVTNSGGCYIEDTMSVKLLKEPEIPNAFSPNGDGINDKWEIGQLNFYFGCTVEVFNRGGQKLFNSVGYNSPWDGTHNGKPLPVGTYYYIINPKNGHPVMSGHVTILK